MCTRALLGRRADDGTCPHVESFSISDSGFRVWGYALMPQVGRASRHGIGSSAFAAKMVGCGFADTDRCGKFQGTGLMASLSQRCSLHIRLMASLSQRCSLHVRSHNGPALKLYVSLLRFKVEKVERDYYAVNPSTHLSVTLRGIPWTGHGLSRDTAVITTITTAKPRGERSKVLNSTYFCEKQDREDALSMVREISKESMGPLWYQGQLRPRS
jgi:hypothetical protein